MLYFTPGPSQLYPTLKHHLKAAISRDIPSLSHRSPAYEKIHRETVDGLNTLLNLRGEYAIYFAGSATEMMERIMQIDLVQRSYHLTNGVFSRRFLQAAKAENVRTTRLNVPDGESIDSLPYTIPQDTDVFCMTHCETSTGVLTPLSILDSLRQNRPELKTVVDVVSSIPMIPMTTQNIDCFFFSVQKGFGMPSGLGILMIRHSFVDEILANPDRDGCNRFHSIRNWWKYASKNQTPETPNILSVFLLGKVIRDMLTVGIDRIRQDIRIKYSMIRQTVKNHPELSMFVKNKNFRSPAMSTINVMGGAETVVQQLQEQGITIGNGYGKYRKDQIRIANFPAHSVGDVEFLCDAVQRL